MRAKGDLLAIIEQLNLRIGVLEYRLSLIISGGTVAMKLLQEHGDGAVTGQVWDILMEALENDRNIEGNWHEQILADGDAE